MPTLPDGREVASDSEEWRLACFEEWKARQPECDRHVRNLLGMFGTEARRQYIERIPADMRERVKAEFLKRWEKR